MVELLQAGQSLSKAVNSHADSTPFLEEDGDVTPALSVITIPNSDESMASRSRHNRPERAQALYLSCINTFPMTLVTYRIVPE